MQEVLYFTPQTEPATDRCTLTTLLLVRRTVDGPDRDAYSVVEGPLPACLHAVESDIRD